MGPAEIYYLDEIRAFTEPADEDVAWLDIAMDQSGIVSLFERLAHLSQ
jgi:hypothetical protein